MYVCNQGSGDEGDLALSRGCALWRAFFHQQTEKPPCLERS